jgi:hypothetical protein
VLAVYAAIDRSRGSIAWRRLARLIIRSPCHCLYVSTVHIKIQIVFKNSYSTKPAHSSDASCELEIKQRPVVSAKTTFRKNDATVRDVRVFPTSNVESISGRSRINRLIGPARSIFHSPRIFKRQALMQSPEQKHLKIYRNVQMNLV